MTFAGVLAAAAIIFHISGLAAQERSIPDHSGFTDCQPCHAGTFKMWETTGHSKAIARIINTPGAEADCFGCHTTEGFAAKLEGGKVDPAKKESFRSITCVACHKPGSSANPKQLVRDSEKLCGECHSQRAVIQGKGAKGIEDMRNPHSGVTCVSCHMSAANHDLKLFLPGDPALPAGRVDTCVGCHKDNSQKIRIKQIRDWHDFYKEAMDPIEASLAEISAAIKAKPDLLNADLKAKLDTVRFNLAIIQKDGSRGAHNLDFALEIMSLASKDIKAIKAAIK